MTEKNALIQLSEALLPDEWCSAGCDHGGGCSLAQGHDGPHQAKGSAGTVLCEWKDDR